MAMAETIEEVRTPRSLREYQLANDRRVGAIERGVEEIRQHIEPIAQMGPDLTALVAIRQREVAMAEARAAWLKRGSKAIVAIGGALNGCYVVGKIFGWWG